MCRLHYVTVTSFFLDLVLRSGHSGTTCQVYKNSVNSGLFIKTFKENQAAKANAPSKALFSDTDIAIVQMFHRG